MVKLIRGATLKVYPGGGHGLAATHKIALNTDLLTFVAGSTHGAARLAL
jgi:non-heme chloroperoxidase